MNQRRPFYNPKRRRKGDRRKLKDGKLRVNELQVKHNYTYARLEKLVCEMEIPENKVCPQQRTNFQGIMQIRSKIIIVAYLIHT